MRDTLQDNGLEPDPATAMQNMWESPYIWVRNSRDTNRTHQHEHENPVHGSSNWVYTKLHNGAATAQSGNLELYYANASAGLRWPDDWTLLKTTDLSSFAGRSTEIAEVEWTNLPGEGHYCLLARWVSPTDPMYTPETEDINANVRNNNNIVWRNLNILSSGTGEKLEARFNIAGRGQDYALAVGPTADEINGSFLMYGTVSVELDELSLSRWIGNGSKGRGFRRQPGSNRVDIIAPEGGVLEGITLDGSPDRNGVVNHSVVLHVTRPPTTPGRSFHLQVEQFYRGAERNSVATVAPTAQYVSLGAVTYELVGNSVRAGSVTIGNDGKLTGAMTGNAWVAGGTGTTFKTPNPCNDDGCFKNTGGKLCTAGTIGACSGASCNWTDNWGAQIGMDTASKVAWGAAAPKALSITYTGGAGSYRLLAHVVGADEGDVYCLNDYVSGQFVDPSMLRARCWSQQPGGALPSFKNVDNLGLQVVSKADAVSFDYCISAIAVR